MNSSTITNKLSLQGFFPDELSVVGVDENENELVIHLHSVSKGCRCHKCGAYLTERHGSHHRSVQDFPIAGKRVTLEAQIYDYQCRSETCGSYASTETFDGFLTYNGRMTERLEDFICLLAVETSCEAASRIMKSIHVSVSGDTVIRLLTKRYRQQPERECGNAIGIDDFSFKKRQRYGTIIVDAATHTPVAVLEGRDASALKEWLKKNRHVTTVTRDRASAYAKAVEEVLLDCMQVADRFHLHNNLMDAVKKAIGRTLPPTCRIDKESDAASVNSGSGCPESCEASAPSTEIVEEGKKNPIHCG